MCTVTNFSCVDEQGFEVACDPFGNNAAFRCLGCSWPVLATIRESQRGSDANHPTSCRACHSTYWLECREAERRLVVHRLPPAMP